MVNDWTNWGVGGDWTDPYERPAALPGLEAYRTPSDDWKRFMSQVQPFWATRGPMADIGRRLQARYLLAAPGMAEQADITPSFGKFLSDYPGRFQADPTFAGYGAGAPMTAGGAARTPVEELAELRLRAGQAAQAGTMAPAAYMGEATPETAEFRRRAWLGQQFGPDAERASENQQRVANLLALQRGGAGGGQYQGQMADAIRNAMANLYQQRQNIGAPRENFLNWYLSQTDPVRKAAATKKAEDEAARKAYILEGFEAGIPSQADAPLGAYYTE
jgi:hypothetical protein